MSYCRVCNPLTDAQVRRNKARQAMASAIEKGTLVPGPCAKCGKAKVHGHHMDYTKPLDVVWLCSRHHADAHGLLRRINFVAND